MSLQLRGREVAQRSALRPCRKSKHQRKIYFWLAERERQGVGGCVGTDGTVKHDDALSKKAGEYVIGAFASPLRGAHKRDMVALRNEHAVCDKCGGTYTNGRTVCSTTIGTRPSPVGWDQRESEKGTCGARVCRFRRDTCVENAERPRALEKAEQERNMRWMRS
jgi:hypothetical protein